jgi:hypothetical protein
MVFSETTTKQGETMFKPADHTRRTPAWLQSRTKENVIWQLAMAALLLAGMYAKDYYDEHKEKQNRLRLVK